MMAIELRKKSSDELRTLLRERQLRRDDLSAALHQKKAKNVKELREVRKDIARIMTIINEQGAGYELSGTRV